MLLLQLTSKISFGPLRRVIEWIANGGVIGLSMKLWTIKLLDWTLSSKRSILSLEIRKWKLWHYLGSIWVNLQICFICLKRRDSPRFLKATYLLRTIWESLVWWATSRFLLFWIFPVETIILNGITEKIRRESEIMYMFII